VSDARGLAPGRPVPGAVSNAEGQILGRKGRETRQRLMAAARDLLGVCSPVDLTAVAVARHAGMASATFYLYFRDVPDLLLATGETATIEMVAAFTQSILFRDRSRIAEDSTAFIEMLRHWWEQHGVILRYRAMEADRGEERFRLQREWWASAVLDRLFLLSREAADTGDDLDAYADALVVFASVERLAAAVQRERDMPIPPERMRAAQARMLVRMLGPA